MNPYPYHHHQTQNHNGFRQHPSPVSHGGGGWVYGVPMTPMVGLYVDEVLILNNPNYDDHLQRLYNDHIPDLTPQINTFWDRPLLPIPYHPLEPNYLENPFYRIEREGSLVFGELTVNQSATTTTASSTGGLSEETITQRLQTTKATEEESDVCAICLEGYHEDDGGFKKIARLECGHGYHVQCIKTWLLRKNVCPMCKATAFTM